MPFTWSRSPRAASTPRCLAYFSSRSSLSVPAVSPELVRSQCIADKPSGTHRGRRSRAARLRRSLAREVLEVHRDDIFLDRFSGGAECKHAGTPAVEQFSRGDTVYLQRIGTIVPMEVVEVSPLDSRRPSIDFQQSGSPNLELCDNVGIGEKLRTPTIGRSLRNLGIERFSLPEGLREGSGHGLSDVGSGIFFPGGS